MRVFLVFFSVLTFGFSSAQEQKIFTVSQDGSGDFSTIQDAINNTKAFPDSRITIFIKNGIYTEKVKLHEWNTRLTLEGENKDSVRIVFNDFFGKIDLGRNSTFFTPSVLVEGNDAVLKNLTIENSAGEVGQAIALSINANRVAVLNCKILGNQDTLYLAGEGKSYFRNCFISGTTDFIFGAASAFFENCEIFSKKDSFVTAASTPENAKFGFVFSNCTFSAAQNVSKVYLGRPWRNFAKTAILNSILGKHVLPEGWHNWDKKLAEETAFFAEFNNSGLGSSTKNRVKWAHQLSRKNSKKYTKKKVLQDKLAPFWYENSEIIN